MSRLESLRPFDIIAIFATFLGGCSFQTGQNVSNDKEFSDLAGTRGVLIGDCNVYWDERQGHAMMTGADLQITGVKKLFEVERGTTVQIVQVIRVRTQDPGGNFETFESLAIVSIKDPVRGGQVLARIPLLGLKVQAALEKQ